MGNHEVETAKINNSLSQEQPHGGILVLSGRKKSVWEDPEYASVLLFSWPPEQLTGKRPAPCPPLTGARAALLPLGITVPHVVQAVRPQVLLSPFVFVLTVTFSKKQVSSVGDTSDVSNSPFTRGLIAPTCYWEHEPSKAEVGQKSSLSIFICVV